MHSLVMAFTRICEIIQVKFQDHLLNPSLRKFPLYSTNILNKRLPSLSIKGTEPVFPILLLTKEFVKLGRHSKKLDLFSSI